MVLVPSRAVISAFSDKWQYVNFGAFAILASIRRRIFRHASTNSVDSIATELAGYGYPVQDADSLLEYLKDQKKVNWSQEPQEVQITNEDYLELRINELLMENEALRQQIESLTRAEGCFDPVEMEEPF